MREGGERRLDVVLELAAEGLEASAALVVFGSEGAEIRRALGDVDGLLALTDFIDALAVSPRPIVVEDTAGAGKSLVKGRHPRWVAGVPVRSPQGKAIAALVVASPGPLALPPWGAAFLQTLARLLERDLEAPPPPSNADRRLVYNAYYDQETELPNERLFRAMAERVLQELADERDGAAVIAIGIDRLDALIGASGPQIGAMLLRALSERIGAMLDRVAVVARLDRNVLGVLVAGSGDGLHGALEELRARALRVPPSGGGVSTTVSIGLAGYPDDGATVEEVLSAAKLALSAAESGGGNDLVRFEAAMRARPASFVACRQRILDALADRRVTVHFQPLFAAEARRLVGFESLVRLRNGDGSLVPPCEFLPCAEESGLLDALTGRVIDTVVGCIEEWEAVAPEAFRIAINLSTRQLHERSPAISRLLQAVEGDPALGRRLEVEITETALMQDGEQTALLLARLRQAGVTVAIDDFGTGYSSLGRLERLPIDKIKIDKSFVDGIPDAAGDLKIVRALIELGHALDLSVVAEGVESEEQHAWLRQAGCDVIQGFLLARPMPAGSARALLSGAAAEVVR